MEEILGMFSTAKEWLPVRQFLTKAFYIQVESWGIAFLDEVDHVYLFSCWISHFVSLIAAPIFPGLLASCFSLYRFLTKEGENLLILT